MNIALSAHGNAMIHQVNRSARLQVRVAAKTTEAQDIAGFELVDCSGEDLPAFTAGSHVDVFMANGLVRQYSLRNNPSERHRYRLGVLRDQKGAGGSIFMHDMLKSGDVIEISHPRNAFPLNEQASSSLLLAGGIGVTPILSMSHRLSTLGQDFALHYCARNLDRMAFRSELETGPFKTQVHFHRDDGPPEQKLNIAELLQWSPKGTHLYVCGPRGFMDAVIGEAERSWPKETIHREYFGKIADVGSSDDRPFAVQIASTGQVFAVPAGESVVSVLGTNGIEIPVSCEQGICGTCVTRVLAGLPDHRDLYLTDAEHAANDQMTPCCSRALSEIVVLDL
ncbi:Phthalate dioxygenase reductase [Aminobacter sp. MSH1]|uniref:PDR/VanB family oxidoreductase n=1 Tax=Aminobacter sp. MSH1 TaxID=374606 RepID=UPI000D505879|nr:PDR/VanB family oxidoreductase [Aminobacter sp. MSH1]AWC24525.1 Phthalate dioxygenase reductase [Aminobacter sp. MSH1]